MAPGLKKNLNILWVQEKNPKESPPGSPTGPLWRKIPAYSAFLRLSLYIHLYLSLRFPCKGAPSMFKNRVPMDRDTPSPEPLFYVFIQSFMYVCTVLKKEPSHIWGKIYGHRPRSPTQTEGLHTKGCGLVPQGYRLQHCYPYPSAMQPSARYIPPWLG